MNIALAGAPAAIGDAPASAADIEAFKATILAKLTLSIGKDAPSASERDWFVATALALRDRVIHRLARRRAGKRRPMGASASATCRSNS